MPEYERHRPRSASEHAFRALLRLYPADFREEFGDAVAEFFRDRLATARREGGWTPLASAWGRTLLDTARQAPVVHLDEWRRRLRRRRARRRAHRNSPVLTHSQRKDWMLSSILQDLRVAARGLRRAPMFTAVVLATLALGIGANAAIYSVVHGVMLAPLPYADPARIVRIVHQAPYSMVSEPEFDDYRKGTRSLETLAAYSGVSENLSGGNAEPERVSGLRVTEGFFRVLGVPMFLGRAFTPDEDRPQAATVVILSYGLWQSRFGSDSGIIGRDVVLNGLPHPVVGVLPPHFDYPSPDIGVFVTLRLNYDSLWTRNNHYLTMVGRLAPGATLQQALTELRTLDEHFQRDYPETYSADKPLRADMAPVGDALLGATRPWLYSLAGSVAFVLLIACANVANLLLARGESRRKELAIRTAMGASRVRVVRQALTESMLLAVGGGVAGLGLAVVGVRLLRWLAPPEVPRLDLVRIDGAVLLFTVGATIVTGFLFGLIPAVRGSREDAAGTLREGGKTSAALGHGLGRIRRTLVVAEVALAVIMLSGAGLMLRSLQKLGAIDLGFQPGRVLSMRVAPPDREYQGTRGAQYYAELLARARELPGVTDAGAVADLPIADGNSIWSILIDGAPMTTVALASSAMPQQVTPGYFEAMRIPLKGGRVFTDGDREDAPLVAVVNETMARKYWPGKSAIGGTIRMLSKSAPWATVVGVVADMRSTGALSDVPPTMYFPHAQAGKSAYFTESMMNLVVRTRGEPAAVAGAMRDLVHRLEPAASVGRVQTMDAVVAASEASRRFTTRLLAGFAAVALLLAAIGLYGIVAHGVALRRFEMGLRMALGAQPGQVVTLVLREGLRTSLLGLAIGTAGALALTRLLRSLLVQVGPGDPLTLVGVALLLLAVAVAASLVPARRASGVDPVSALRAE